MPSRSRCRPGRRRTTTSPSPNCITEGPSSVLRLLDTTVTLRPAQPGDLDFVWSVYADGLRPYLSTYRPWDEAGQRQRFPRLYDAAHSAIVLCEGVAAGFESGRASWREGGGQSG